MPAHTDAIPPLRLRLVRRRSLMAHKYLRRPARSGTTVHGSRGQCLRDSGAVATLGCSRKKGRPTQGEDPAASGGDRNDVNVNGGEWTISSRVLWISISGGAIEPRILASTSARHADRENWRRTWPTTVVHRGDLWKLEHGYSTDFSRRIPIYLFMIEQTCTLPNSYPEIELDSIDWFELVDTMLIAVSR